MAIFTQSLGRSRANHASPYARYALELTILAVIWLILAVLYAIADYPHASKAQRYQLERVSVTDGVTKPALLNQFCGDKFLTQLASHRADKDFSPATLCAGSQSPQALAASITSANTQFNQIQQALAVTWQQQKAKDRHANLVSNETEQKSDSSNSANARQDWLNLNDDGQLDSVKVLQNWLNPTISKPVAKNTLIATATVKPEIDPPSIALQNLSATDKTNLSIALQAVADGNRRFAYSRMFASQPSVAVLLNKVTADIATIYDANQNKNRAEFALQLLPLVGDMRHLALLPQVLIWSLAAWLMLVLSRQNRHPLLLFSYGMVIWGAVIALVSHDIIAPMKVGLIIFCVGVFLSAISLFNPIQKLRQVRPDNREQLASPWLFPLFVGFTTFGMLILLDLSSRSYLSLRYLFLAHFKDLFIGYVLLSYGRVVAYLVGWVLQKLLANTLLQLLWGNVKNQITHARLLLGVMILGYLGLAVLFHNDSAKVAELGKMWFIAFLALFLAINQRTLINHLLFKSKKMTAVLLLCVMIPVLALVIANEKGTILVMLFMITFMVGVALSNRIFQMGGRGYILGVLSSTAILLVLMMALVNLSGFDARTAERVNTWLDPFASTNDQMAILHWFRESTPLLGFGFGDIPWCGYRLTNGHLSGCRGVPLQMQSDYTITSVMAVTGMGLGVVFIGLYVAWLVLMANQQVAFANEQMSSRMVSTSYILLAWVILVWVILTIFQAIVTISGNLGMLPLTGVTLPFVSYGTSSLWFNCVMFGLALFVPKLVVKRD